MMKTSPLARARVVKDVAKNPELNVPFARFKGTTLLKID